MLQTGNNARQTPTKKRRAGRVLRCVTMIQALCWVIILGLTGCPEPTANASTGPRSHTPAPIQAPADPAPTPAPVSPAPTPTPPPVTSTPTPTPAPAPTPTPDDPAPTPAPDDLAPTPTPPLPPPPPPEPLVKVAIGEPSEASTIFGPVTYPVTYTDAARVNLYPEDVTLATNGSVTGTIQVNGLGTSTRNVTISDICGNGTANIVLAAGTASNADDIPAPAVAASKSFHTPGVLEPGSGFLSPTPQPPAIGSGPGADAKAIARWDVVPYQTYDGLFEIGVVAFHINGIDRVEFLLDDGPPLAVKEMTLNPRTNVVEYWTSLDAARSPDGPVEIRAIVYPKTGVPRVLGGPIVDDSRMLGEYSMFLSANSRGTLASPEVWVDSAHGDDEIGDGTSFKPFKSLWRASKHLADTQPDGNGAVILCKPGDYEYFRPNGSTLARTSDRWLTVRPAPGVERNEVILIDPADGKSNNGLNSELVRFQSITITATLAATPSSPRRLWLDSCHLRGASLWSEGWYRQNFCTDCLATDMGHTFMGSDLVRNAEVVNVNNDVFCGTAVAINSKVSGQNAEGTDNHSDIWQPRSILDNIILYGIDASAPNNVEQGFFTRTSQHNDVAIVNCAVNLRGYPCQNQWRTETHHFYMRNCSFIGAPFTFALTDSSSKVNGFQGSTNIQLEKNVFQWVNIDSFAAIADETTAIENHFINRWPDYTDRAGNIIGITFGRDFTTGWKTPGGVGSSLIE